MSLVESVGRALTLQLLAGSAACARVMSLMLFNMTLKVGRGSSRRGLVHFPLQLGCTRLKCLVFPLGRFRASAYPGWQRQFVPKDAIRIPLVVWQIGEHLVLIQKTGVASPLSGVVGSLCSQIFPRGSHLRVFAAWRRECIAKGGVIQVIPVVGVADECQLGIDGNRIVLRLHVERDTHVHAAERRIKLSIIVLETKANSSDRIRRYQ